MDMQCCNTGNKANACVVCYCVLLCVVSLQITKDEFFAEVLRDILLYVSRDLGDKVLQQNIKIFV